MDDVPDNGVSRGLADLALSVRRCLEAEEQRELQDGLTRRHLNIVEYRQRYLAAQFARVLRLGPVLGAVLGIREREG